MQRITQAVRGALAVLVAGILLMQQVPIHPAGHAGMTHGDGHVCTERTCECVRAGRSCTGASCPHHAASEADYGDAAVGRAWHREPAASHAESEGTGNQARCSRPAPGPSPAVVFAVYKSLLVPASAVAAVAAFSKPPHLERREVFAPQRTSDELFRPPRPGIG